MERLSISKELLEKVMNYVGQGSYIQVAGLIAEVQKDVKPIEPEIETKPE